jgi:hypothetical protein
MKEELKEAHYKYEKYLGNSSHLIRNLNTDRVEIFVSNKRHASWGLIWRNTHLEFLRSVDNHYKNDFTAKRK